MTKGIDLSYAKPKVAGNLPRFNIIHHRGTLGEATTKSGAVVKRSESIYMPTFPAIVKCAPYDNHFIYRVPKADGVIGASSLMCTCGSMAVVVGHNAYKNDASPQGQMLVCHWHATYGKHADGGQ